MVYWYKLKTRSPYYQSTYAINHIYFFKKQMHCFFASTLLFLYTFLAIYLVQLYLDSKEIKPANPKRNQSWMFIGRTDAEAETPIVWPPDGKNWLIGKTPWCWERLKARGEGGNRGCMASSTQWTWVWANSWRLWGTEKPAMLQSAGLQSDITDRLNNNKVPPQL